MRALEQQWAELEIGQTDLLAKLARERLDVGLARFDAAVRVGSTRSRTRRGSGSGASGPSGATTTARTASRIGRPELAACELLEPAQPLRPRHGGVRGRGGRKDEEPRVAERPLLEAELRPHAERAAVRLLADEGEPRRPQLARDPLETLGGAGEVGAAQVARAGRRAVGGVRDADSLLEQGELLGAARRGARSAALRGGDARSRCAGSRSAREQRPRHGPG